jgi:hypothetical protein
MCLSIHKMVDSAIYNIFVISSQESPTKDETFRDFECEKNLFVEYRSPLSYDIKQKQYHMISLGKSSFE